MTASYQFAGQYGPEALIDTSNTLLLNQSVTIKNLDGTNATLYTTRLKAATATNPTTTSAIGNLSFFADPGQYNMVVVIGGIVTSIPIDVAADSLEDTANPYNVKRYGAIGDGSTDDAGFIQAAVTAAAAATNGGVVFFPPGIYKMDTTVSWAANQVRLLGSGPLITKIIAPAAALAFDIGDNVSIYHYTYLEQICVTRPIAGGAGLIRMRKIDQWHIARCNLAAGTFNLQLTACIAGHVDQNQISSHTQYGIRYDNCDQVNFTGNTYETNAGGTTYHLYCESGNKAVTHDGGNIFSTASYALFADGGPSNDCGFTCNNIENCPNGVLVAPATNPSSNRWTITDNTMRGTGAGAGVTIYGTDNTITGNTITGYSTNSIVENNGAGGVGRNNISGNTVDVAPSLQSATSINTNNTLYAIPTVASATTVTLIGGHLFKISGTTTIDVIAVTGQTGRRVTLIFLGALTVGDGSGNLKLAGNFVTTTDDTLTLVCDGTYWYEVARSVN